MVLLWGTTGVNFDYFISRAHNNINLDITGWATNIYEGALGRYWFSIYYTKQAHGFD